MTEDAGKISLRWEVTHVSSPSTRVPKLSGLYAIGHDKAYYGLEAGREYVYIGQSNDLRRRLEEHLPNTEQNPILRQYLRDNAGRAKIWYAVVDEDQLTEIETDLIREFKPYCNRQGT